MKDESIRSTLPDLDPQSALVTRPLAGYTSVPKDAKHSASRDICAFSQVPGNYTFSASLTTGVYALIFTGAWGTF